MSDVMTHLALMPDDKYAKAVKGMGLDEAMKKQIDSQRAAVRAGIKGPTSPAQIQFVGAPQAAPVAQSAPVPEAPAPVASGFQQALDERARRKALEDSIRSKIYHSPTPTAVMPGMLKLDQLAKLGIMPDPQRVQFDGAAVALDPNRLTTEEKQHLIDLSPAQPTEPAPVQIAANWGGQ